MTTKSKSEPVSLSTYHSIKDQLKSKLTRQLEMEAEMNEFEDDNLGDIDIVTMPVVDSKSVIKLSPIVEQLTGQKIKPEWIKKGGYKSIQDAVGDVMRHLEKSLK